MKPFVFDSAVAAIGTQNGYLVALYRTVQDCWTLDLAGHGRNTSP